MKIINDWINKYGQENYFRLFDVSGSNDFNVCELSFTTSREFHEGQTAWLRDTFRINLIERYKSLCRDNLDDRLNDSRYVSMEKLMDTMGVYVPSEFFVDSISDRAKVLRDIDEDKMCLLDVLCALFPFLPRIYDENSYVQKLYNTALGYVYESRGDIKKIYEDHGDYFLSPDSILEFEYSPKGDRYRIKFLSPIWLHHLYKKLECMYNLNIQVSTGRFREKYPSADMRTEYSQPIHLYRLGRNIAKDYAYLYDLEYRDGTIEVTSDSDFFPPYVFTPFEDELNIAKINFASRTISYCDTRIDSLNQSMDKANNFLAEYKSIGLNEYVEGA